ncbi:MAG: hypothetical protein ACRDSE_01535 [Pseudonocardiaceae bacterium]
MINTSTERRTGKRRVDETTTQRQGGSRPVTEHAHEAAAIVPVPRVDEDDFAPTIIRGRE